MDSARVNGWFTEYLDTFAACARGDREMAALLRLYRVPLIITSDDGAIVLSSSDEIATVMQGQIDALRAAGYHHTDVLQSDVTVFNAASALYRGTFSRRDRGGAEIGCPVVAYLLTEGSTGPQITVLAASAA